MKTKNTRMAFNNDIWLAPEDTFFCTATVEGGKHCVIELHVTSILLDGEPVGSARIAAAKELQHEE